MKEKLNYKRYLLKAKNLYQQPVVEASTNLVFTLIIICIFAVFAIKPTLITITKLNKELKEKKEINKILEQKINALNKAQVSYAKITDYLGFVDRALPKKVGFNQAASQINFLTFSNNLILLSASFGKFDLIASSPESTEANTLDFKISVNGLYPDIKNFLQELENIDRVVQINSIVFSRKAIKNQIQLQLDLTGKIFWLEDEK